MRQHINKLKFSVTYKRLFEVQLFHSYYRKGIARDVKLKPTNATLQTVRNLGLQMFVSPENHITILYNTKLESGTIDALKEGGKFTFRLEVNHPLFFNFTDIPDIIEEQILLLTNLNENDKQLLTKGNQISPEDIVDVGNELETIEITKDASTIKLTDIHENTVFEETCQPPVYFMNLRDDGEGYYQFHLNDEIIGSYYIQKNNNPCLGMVELHFGEHVPVANNPLTAENRIESKIFKINFEARKTFWKYYFINQNENNYNQYTITDASLPLTFSNEGKVELFNGQEAELLVAEEPLSLKEAPETNFRLNMKKNGKGINFQMNLPNASVEIIKPHLEEKSKVYSEIFVYL